MKLKKLPIAIEKIETLAILRQLSEAKGALGELKGIVKTIPNHSILLNTVVLQEAKDSSEIENIITTQDELYKALVTEGVFSNPVKEVINYRKAIFFGYDILKTQGFLRMKDIKNLQKIIIENNAGIRNMPGTVLKNDKTGEIVYTPPQEKDEILDLLANFLEHFNLNKNQVSPIINLAILHHQFESTHPFYDGNGRTGRILNILYLILNNLLDTPILYLSSYIKENKAKYYQLLNKVNETGEWEEWIIYMLKAIEITAKNTIQKINLIKSTLEETISFVKKNAPKIYKKEFIELLFEQPYSKINIVVTRLNIDRKTALKYLRNLEEIGILDSQKVGREVIYLNKNLLTILEKP